MNKRCKTIVRNAGLHCADCFEEDADWHKDLYEGIRHCDGCEFVGEDSK